MAAFVEAAPREKRQLGGILGGLLGGGGYGKIFLNSCIKGPATNQVMTFWLMWNQQVNSTAVTAVTAAMEIKATEITEDTEIKGTTKDTTKATVITAAEDTITITLTNDINL